MPLTRDGLDRLDLGSLSIFLTVYRLRSFSRAADQLGTNQPRVSYAVGKLRAVFKDPMFVRCGIGIEPTDKCHQVATLARQVLDSLESITHAHSFEPVTADDLATVSCNQYQRELILPPLLMRLRNYAPRLRLRVVTASNRGVVQLHDGDTDLLICPTVNRGEGLHYRTLLNERYMCLVCSQSTWAKRDLTLADYVSAQHATVNYGDGWQSGYMRLMDEQGTLLDQRIIVPSPTDLRFILPETDLISTIPERQARQFGRGFACVPCPVPAPFKINLYWAPRTHFSPMFSWLRMQIADVSRDIPDVIRDQ